MNDPLPEWYPLANAPYDEIDAWLASAVPPYEGMRAALPWLHEQYQFDAWLEGVREARASVVDASALLTLFPGVAQIPLPPRRAAGRQ